MSEQAPLTKEDLLPFGFWWVAGVAVGALATLVLIWLTPIEMNDKVAGIPVVAGGVAGWAVWWHLRGLGT